MKTGKPILRAMASMLIGGIGIFSSSNVHAADGCKFLLCIAGPWQGIAECRPTVHEVFRDLARGRPFPTCAMSGAGNSASNTWASEPTCPIMYRSYDPDRGSYVGCRYPGQISVQVNGQPWSTVYWDFGGNTSTRWTDAAVQQVNQPGVAPVDTDTFKNDVNSWNTHMVSNCTGSGGAPVYNSYGAFESCEYPNWSSGS
jgi:hypothetical protein